MEKLQNMLRRLPPILVAMAALIGCLLIGGYGVLAQEKPAEKPVEKPAEKPVEKPVDKPADKPAGEAANDAPGIPIIDASSPPFAILRIGNPNAKISTVGNALDAIGMNVGMAMLPKRDDGVQPAYRGLIANTRSDFDTILTKEKLHWVLVDAAWWLSLEKAPEGWATVLENRHGEDFGTRYVILTKPANIVWRGKDLDGKRIATTLTDASDYLDKVVTEQNFLPKWEAVENLDSALLAIIDDETWAHDGVLMPEHQAKGYMEAKHLKGQFAKIWTSELLPDKLLIANSTYMEEAARTKLKTHMQSLEKSESGKEVLALLDVERWCGVNDTRLKTCTRLLALDSKRPKPAEKKEEKAEGEEKPEEKQPEEKKAEKKAEKPAEK